MAILVEKPKLSEYRLTELAKNGHKKPKEDSIFSSNGLNQS